MDHALSLMQKKRTNQILRNSEIHGNSPKIPLVSQVVVGNMNYNDVCCVEFEKNITFH